MNLLSPGRALRRLSSERARRLVRSPNPTQEKLNYEQATNGTAGYCSERRSREF